MDVKPPSFIVEYPPVLWALALFFLCLGFTAPIDIPLAVLAFTAAYAFNQQSHPFSWPDVIQEHWPLIFFLAIAAITTITSVDPRHSLSVQPQLLPALLSYCVITQFITTPARQRFLCGSLLACGSVTVTLMLVGVRNTISDDPLEKIKLLGNALFIVPNDVLMLSIIAPLVLAVARDSNTLIKCLAAAYLLLTLIASVIIGSRQAVLVFILGQALFFVIVKPKWFLPIVLFSAVTGTTLDWLLGWPLANKIMMFPRTYVWHTAWIMFLDSPWLGQGPGMFKDLYFPFLKKAGYIAAELGDYRNMPWAHNLYLEQLAERGIGGLLALVSLLVTATRQAWIYTRNSSSESTISLGAGLLGALLALSIAGIAEATLSRLWVTVLLLSITGLCTALNRNPH
jgi:O-antigen ligase